jgi:hypothetical protein
MLRAIYKGWNEEREEEIDWRRGENHKRRWVGKEKR